MFHKGRIVIIVISIMLIIGVFLFFNFFYSTNLDLKTNYSSISEQSKDEKEDSKDNAANKTSVSDIKNIENIKEYISYMTVEEKVGQLFIISVGRSDDDLSKNMNSNLEQIINKYKPGGVILFNENIESINQTKSLIEDIQDKSLINAFVSVDEEGGLVSRINSSDELHATEFVSNVNLGNINDLELTKKVGEVIGTELKSLGFNMDFAPVADINTNPDNPIIGDRAFGSEPELVSDNVIAEVKGFKSVGVIPVIKHFPGHGDASTDSHETEVIIKHDRERIETVELVPFRKSIENGIDVIMTAHIKMPNVTNEDLPATMSKEVLTGILREDLGYENIIITDALEMKAISSYWSSEESAVKAFLAGADMLLLPASLEDAYTGIINAIENGDISEERLDESVYRIMKLKRDNKILDDAVKLNAEEVLGCKEHLEVADEVKERSN